MASAEVNLLSSLHWGVFWLIVIAVVVIKEGMLSKRSGAATAPGQATWRSGLATTGIAVVVAAVVAVPVQMAAPALLSTANLPEPVKASGAALDDPDSLVAQGEMVFRTKGCLGCHTIAGVSEIGTVGPELTHIGSSELIASSIPYSPENLRDWLINPHELKPGTEMPNMNLSEPELDAIVAFLDSLK